MILSSSKDLGISKLPAVLMLGLCHNVGERLLLLLLNLSDGGLAGLEVLLK